MNEIEQLSVSDAIGAAHYGAAVELLELDGEPSDESSISAARITLRGLIKRDSVLTPDNPVRVCLRNLFGKQLIDRINRHRFDLYGHTTKDTAKLQHQISAFSVQPSGNFAAEIIDLINVVSVHQYLRPSDIITVQFDRSKNAASVSSSDEACFHSNMPDKGLLLPHRLAASRLISDLRALGYGLSQHNPGNSDDSFADGTPLIRFGRFTTPIPTQLVMVLGSRHNTITLSQRGAEFVGSILEMIVPGIFPKNRLRPSLALGSSSSWACVFVDPGLMTDLLSGGGWFSSVLEELCGLRRLTLLQASSNPGAGGVEEKFIYFVNAVYKPIIVHEITEGHAFLSADADFLASEQKVRSFRAMCQKLFPNLQLTLGDSKSWSKWTGITQLSASQAFTVTDPGLAAQTAPPPGFGTVVYIKRSHNSRIAYAVVEALSGQTALLHRTVLNKAEKIELRVGDTLRCTYRMSPRGLQVFAVERDNLAQ